MSIYAEKLLNLSMQNFRLEDEIRPVYEESFDDEFKTHQSLSLPRNEVKKPEARQVTDPVFQTTYQICLRPHELPVIGTFVDERILPGFYYRVRRLGDDGNEADFLFDGRPRRLVSIGMGYGKRITFRGDDSRDNTDFYFYSDTEANGFAFLPAVPETHTKFLAVDDNQRSIADVKVTDISIHQISSQTNVYDKTITNHIAVDFTANMDFHTGAGGLLPLHSSLSDVEIHGYAVMQRLGNTRNDTKLVRIENVSFGAMPDTYTLLPC